MSVDLCKRVPYPYLVLVCGIAAAYWATGRLALLAVAKDTARANTMSTPQMTPYFWTLLVGSNLM